VKLQQNQFDLTIDDMTPFQSNLNSKMFYNQKHFEEEKNIQSNETILFNGHLANKSKKSNTEIKILAM
jgi:hypothetical protein